MNWPRKVTIESVTYYFDHELDDTHAEYRTDDDQPSEMVRDSSTGEVKLA